MPVANGPGNVEFSLHRTKFAAAEWPLAKAHRTRIESGPAVILLGWEVIAWDSSHAAPTMPAAANEGEGLCANSLRHGGAGAS